MNRSGANSVAEALVLALLLALVIAMPIASQTQSSLPKWEAVSIKPCGPNSLPEGQRGDGPPGPPFRFNPDRMILKCMTVRTLIASAYKTYLDDPNIPGPQGKDDVLIGGMPLTTPITGGPVWIDFERYMIEAKAERSTDRGTMQGPMLQSILKDRFQLKVHLENREVPIYALSVAKGGPKLKRFQEGSCIAYHHPDVNDLTGPPPPPPPLPGGQRYCSWGGGVRGNEDPPQVKMDLEGVTMDQFVKIWLSGQDGRKVIDKTGLKGKFDIRLEYAMDEAGRQRFARVMGRPLSDIPSSPSIFTALQEQLGLKLDSARGPAEFLAIDHVERPTEN